MRPSASKGTAFVRATASAFSFSEWRHLCTRVVMFSSFCTASSAGSLSQHRWTADLNCVGTEGKRSSSCTWLERALSQIVVWCVMARFSLPGKVVTVARHLGSHLGVEASFAHELPRRRQATMTAFYSVDQLWYESRVSWRLKRCFFIGRVVNTGLSGIEAVCPSKAQYQSLTSLVTCLARRVMQGQRREGRSWARPHSVQQGGYCVSGNWHLVMWKPGCEDSHGHRFWCRILRTTHN